MFSVLRFFQGAAGLSSESTVLIAGKFHISDLYIVALKRQHWVFWIWKYTVHGGSSKSHWRAKIIFNKLYYYIWIDSIRIHVKNPFDYYELVANKWTNILEANGHFKARTTRCILLSYINKCQFCALLWCQVSVMLSQITVQQLVRTNKNESSKAPYYYITSPMWAESTGFPVTKLQ